MNKIWSAFDNVKSFPLKRIVIQYWAPMKNKTSGKQVLSCYGFPYALSHLNHRLLKYRSGCCNYSYSFDCVRTPPHCTVLRKGYPEVVLDLTLHRGTLFVDLALECELTCFMLLPVFDETGRRGVIEVSMRQPSDLLVIFNDLYRELERVGLSFTFKKNLTLLQGRLPSNLESAESEIHRALEVAVQSHGITLASVWVSYMNCIEDRPLPWMTHRLFWKSADGFFGNPVGRHDLCLELFSCILHAHFLRSGGNGLVGKTIELKRPYLCRNIYQWSENKGLLALLSTNAKSYACFVIGLRSSHTGDFDYALEFFWPKSRNHLALMEDLLLTLKEHLPSFTYSSRGAQLGHQLNVVDFEDVSLGMPSESEIKTIKIFPTKVTRASVGRKRKSIVLHDAGQSELNQYAKDDDDLVILAFFEVHHRLFFLPKSSTFENVIDKIKLEFGCDLNPDGTYQVDYQVLPGKWYRLTDDTCLKNCISSFQASSNIGYIRFCVLPVEGY